MTHDELLDGAKFRVPGYPDALFQKMPWDKDSDEKLPASSRYSWGGCSGCDKRLGYGPTYVWNTLNLNDPARPYRVHFCAHNEVIPVEDKDE